MVGPPRCGTQAALQDLAAIRTGTAGAPTRSEGLQAMERIAKRLRDEAQEAMRGGLAGPKPTGGVNFFLWTGAENHILSELGPENL